MINNRLCIYPKDIAIITGRGLRYSQRLLKAIRIKLKKKQHQYVSVQDFAEYTGIELQLIIKACN